MPYCGICLPHCKCTGNTVYITYSALYFVVRHLHHRLRRLKTPHRWMIVSSVNHRQEDSRSVNKVNDRNKAITCQTQLAAPVTEYLFYYHHCLCPFLPRIFENRFHGLISIPGWSHYEMQWLFIRYTTYLNKS